MDSIHYKIIAGRLLEQRMYGQGGFNITSVNYNFEKWMIRVNCDFRDEKNPKIQVDSASFHTTEKVDFDNYQLLKYLIE